MCDLFMLRVSWDTQIFDDLGLGERSLCGLGGGDLDFDLLDRRYLSRDLERDVLLPEDEEEALRLRLLHFDGGDLFRLGEAAGLLLVVLVLTDCDGFFSATLDLPTLLAELERLLLLEELPVEDPDELAELEREPDRLELPPLLPDVELRR